MMKVFYTPLVWCSIIMLALCAACIDESSKVDCAQGFTLSFYSKVPCRADTAYVGNTAQLTLCIFDENEVLVASRQKENVNLHKPYTEEFEIDGGQYTVITWCGIGHTHFEISELQHGVTRKDDLLFRLNRQGELATSIQGTRVFTGESAVIDVPQYKVPRSELPHSAVNLLEVTNRLTIEVEGLLLTEDYEVFIEADNGSMNIDGTLAADEHIQYAADDLSVPGLLKVHFTLLKLVQGQDYQLVIKHKTTNAELFRGDLPENLLLRNPAINFGCDHDFNIHFKADDVCDCDTYTILEIWVNDWLVYSYDTEL